MYLFAPVARWSLACVPGTQANPFLHFLVASAALVGLSAALAVVTYCLIEHPFLALRDAWLKKPLKNVALAKESEEHRMSIPGHSAG